MLLQTLLTVAVAFFAVDPARDPAPTPLMRVVEPYKVKAGAEVVVTGDNLSKKYVADVFLQIRGANTKVEVLEQSDTTLKFRVPETVKPGSYRIIVLLTTVEPVLIEEPVKLIIEE